MQEIKPVICRGIRTVKWADCGTPTKCRCSIFMFDRKVKDINKSTKRSDQGPLLKCHMSKAPNPSLQKKKKKKSPRRSIDRWERFLIAHNSWLSVSQAMVSVKWISCHFFLCNLLDSHCRNKHILSPPFRFFVWLYPHCICLWDFCRQPQCNRAKWNWCINRWNVHKNKKNTLPAVCVSRNNTRFTHRKPQTTRWTVFPGTTSY